MRRSPLWREFESGDSFLLRTLRFLILAGGVLFLAFSATLPLRWEHQLLFAAVTMVAAFLMNRGSKSYVVTLTLVLLSVYSTCRYAFWRFSSVSAFFRDPGNNWTALDVLFIGLLLLAECYAFTVLVLGYVQVLWPLRRSPVPLPDDPDDWPAVDLLIPTLNEPLSVVRFTALAAMNIDWPADKLHVYILDDGRRKEFRVFAEEAGIGYMSRDENQHAKAGNINHALSQLDSPFVAIFDCDHVPTRSFLQVTMGWLLRDQKLAMLQTPHHFYSPDPFERNLDQFRVIPSEDELFYGVVQDGNDFWNATCFCGSCAVLRRSALDQVGGMAVETATEDTHTSLRLQKRGWNTAYLNIPQAAGLATERLSAHVKQRIRWARGMVQILRIENPLFARGLKASQRLCYFNAMAHFLFALPRLIFLTAPLIYLIFGMTSIPGFWAAIVAYALPHLVLSNLTHSRIQGGHRHSFWNEIYETVLAPYILLPTLVALINPKAGRFNVTGKGGVVDEDYFDARIARPFLLLLLFNLFGLICAIARMWRFPTFAVPPWLSLANWPAHIYDGGHRGIIAVNAVWVLFNLVILGVVTAVSRESQQRRETVRVAMAVPSDVILPDGTMIQGVTADLSTGGVRTTVEGAVKARVGDSIQFVFSLLNGTATLPATIVSVDGNELRARFSSLSLQQGEALATLLYSRADAWLGSGETRRADNPLGSFGHILKLSMRGLALTVGGAKGRKISAKARLATSIAPILLLAAAAGLAPRVVRGAQVSPTAPTAASTDSIATPVSSGSTAPGTFDTVFKLSDVGAPEPIVLHGVDSSYSVHFSVAGTQLTKNATMKLKYRFSPGLLPGISHLNVSLNGSLFATLAVSATANQVEQAESLEALLTLPVDLLLHDNTITFEFIGHYAQQCEDPTNSTLWSQINSTSTIELKGSRIAPANDLNALPLPFYEPGVNSQPSVPIVFLTRPSPKGMQAAGIVASWLGILNGSRPVRFPVSIGTIPASNAIVLAENASEIPASLLQQGPAIAGSTVAIRTNPLDSNSSVLLIAGNDSNELLQAARALVLNGNAWQRSQIAIHNLELPAPLRADDSPRWLSTDKAVTIGQMEQANGPGGNSSAELQSDGSTPINLYLHLPPDLDFGDRRNLALHLSYRYNGVPLGNGSTLQVYVNGAFVSATPAPHTEKASAVLETVVPIPIVDLRPFSNTISLKFMFQVAKSGSCENTVPPNFQGSILKDSYLDLTGIPHSATLPNLELFANAGYPFTREADLADTSVLLPLQPSTNELELFLTMMGHFGAQTGYPVLNVLVTNPSGLGTDGTKDYLVMGTIEDQPALRRLGASLPVAVDGTGLHIHGTQSFLDRAGWWRPGEDSTQAGQLAAGGELPDALVEEVRWPSGSNRSAVVIMLRDDDSIPNFLSTFLKTSQSSDIAQSVSVLHNSRFSSYRVGNDSYTVGETSPFASLTRILQAFPWMIAVVTLMCCFLMAVLVQARLRRHARLRLQGSE